MAPYYIIMRLPGEPQAEFFLMLPMVPSRRDNMIAWLAARCDPPDYGKLIVYEFPKEKLVYGPFQIEARINQNTEISQQLTLWNQMGSRVIRGNLLVIPIENSILYVSPLYLRAEQGHLPELKRVIAAYGEHVVMKETLAEALSALFMEPGAAPAVPSAATGNAARRPGGKSGTGGARPLQSSNRAIEIRRLDGLRHGVRRDARAFGGYESDNRTATSLTASRPRAGQCRYQQGRCPWAGGARTWTARRGRRSGGALTGAPFIRSPRRRSPATSATPSGPVSALSPHETERAD